MIWVEGPSDRIYLNYWLKGKRDNFIEGIHYSIMFYGGKLACHLTAKDKEDDPDDAIDDFIELRKLNRNSAILLDSDKKSEDDSINDTKERLKREFEKNSWVTKGREIENYLGDEKVKNAMKSVHPRAIKNLLEIGQWINLLNYVNNEDKKKTADKVKVAKRYIENNPEPDYKMLDLNERLNTLCEFIDAANGHKS